MDQGREELRQQAGVMILEAVSVTDALTDEEARPLIAWGLSQGEAVVEALWASGKLVPLPSGEARGKAAKGVAPVRSVMRAVSRLVSRRSALSPDEVFEELEALRTAAGELPLPPGEAMTDTALAELAAWQSKLDTRTFVGAILYLLGPVSDANTPPS